MTIYTDPVTGRKYDRVPGGVAVSPGSTQGYKPCSECAFSGLWDEACTRAMKHCIIKAPSKTVFFVFRGRKA